MPKRAFLWLTARPTLWAAWLMWRNAWRRWPYACTAATLCVIGLGALGRVPVVKHALATLSSSSADIFTVTAVVLTATILRRWRRLAMDHHRGWLRALPGDLSPTARAALAPLPIWAGVVAVSALVALVANLPLSACALLLASTGGYLASIVAVLMVVGWMRWGALGVGTRAAPPSQYAVVRQVRRDWAARPRLASLGYWPVAQAGFWDRPKRRARSLILVLLAMPLGVSGAVVLAVACAWLVLLHLLNLLGAVIRVAFAASWWLAPTPVGVLRFTAAVSHRALGRQFITSAVAVAAIFAVAGAAVGRAALSGASGWLGIACLVSATACVLALGSSSVAESVLHRWMR
jgi:hypothetical protein